MNSNVTRTLISIGGAGASLTVTVSQQATMSPEEPWFDTEITADAFPFGGTLKTVFTLSDLRRWAEALSALQAGTGRVVLGGGRAAELGLKAERQRGEPPDRVAVSVDLVPSADDPYPKLAWSTCPTRRQCDAPFIGCSASSLSAADPCVRDGVDQWGRSGALVRHGGLSA